MTITINDLTQKGPISFKDLERGKVYYRIGSNETILITDAADFHTVDGGNYQFMTISPGPYIYKYTDRTLTGAWRNSSYREVDVTVEITEKVS